MTDVAPSLRSMRPDPTGLPRLSVVGPPHETPAQPRRAFTAQIMGLPVSIHVRGPEARSEEVANTVDRAFERLRADDTMFSTYLPDSDISRVRRGELGLGDAHPRVRRIAALCKEATARTEGAFSAWLPGPAGTPTFDPSGLVKGWAVQDTFDQLNANLAQFGPHDTLVSAGGDVAVFCTRTDTPDWQIGVEDPRDQTRMLLIVPLRRGAVATSGTAARGQHIVDPATGAPATSLLSATVIGPNLTWADVYATAAFVKGVDATAWIDTLPDHTGIVVPA